MKKNSHTGIIVERDRIALGVLKSKIIDRIAHTVDSKGRSCQADTNQHDTKKLIIMFQVTPPFQKMNFLVKMFKLPQLAIIWSGLQEQFHYSIFYCEWAISIS